ncbi:MAG: exodeoxyribonuclease gamma subunit [Hydrocarboniphaga sp.]|uniref:exodeoxyribonuclease V subunit gamma n=1 Tax=Hydrocarboniphaga sp. TaxID=2033016 RepID=UPI00261659BA|nr:exodeoxyribonuclease V subunit gamma [Hydrocarboniphaga sp.]MDB5968886.1 exodeoxyribonuclease gamma subunit [Hydrocarboniphaga sp.]
MLKIIHGNRLEPLAGELMRSLLQAPASPFEREIIVVPSLGVARWLQYRIADVLSVCARVEFPYPAQFIWQSFARVLADAPERSPFDADVMTLRLFALLGRLPQSEDYAPLASYLVRTGERGRLDLAQALARTFDQYLVYRPDWLAAWTANRTCALQPLITERWQQRLWRRLIGEAGLAELQHPADAAFARLDAEPALAAQLLPQRLRVFGVTSLPPQYAAVLARLGRHVEVEWYVPNPCRLYWADIVSERAQAQLALNFDDTEQRDVGHPLLASWGGQARDHLATVMDQLDRHPAVEETPYFVEPEGEHLLARLQRSLLNLAPLAEAALPLDLADNSIQLLACHSLTRQLEVLHDRLLGRFDADATLRPADIVVMLPDPESAAATVDAVFGAAPFERLIAYTITGSAAPDAAPLLRAFAALIDLPRSRFVAAEVFDFLQLPAVAARYELDEPELEQLHLWLAETGVRWALDGAHRGELGLPAEPRNTWLDGLLRLLLGYAMPTSGEALFAGVLPYEDIEGSQSITLGKLARVLADLVALRDELSRPRTLSAWCDRLLQAIGRCLSPTSEDESDERRLRLAIGSLREDARSAALDEAVELDVARRLIDARLSASSPGGVPGGGVTFTGIGPLRGLPYRIVVLLGLDGGAFPRNPAATEFDLMAAHPRRGDRARRVDDRGAFLDALLAARDALWIGFQGRSLRDNALLPPSVLVSELIDYVGRFVIGGRDAVAKALIAEHALQPFDARYFRRGPQQSYAREYLAAADAMQRGPALPDESAEALFDGSALPALPDAEWKQLTLDRLAMFLRNPLRFLLRERVGVRIDEADEELPGEEPLDLPEAKWTLRDRLLRHALAGDSESAIVDLLGASPEIPHGRWGRRLLEREVRPAMGFARQALTLRGELLPPLNFELAIGEYRLSGVLDGLTAQGLFAASYRDIGALDWLDAWPRHLLLQLLAPAGVARTTRILAKNGVHALQPVEDAEAHLADLLALYWQGLHLPLSFLPKTAYELLEKDQRRATDVWLGNAHSRGESREPYSQLRYRDSRRVLPEGFDAEARRMLAPLLAARGAQ